MMQDVCIVNEPFTLRLVKNVKSQWYETHKQRTAIAYSLVLCFCITPVPTSNHFKMLIYFCFQVCTKFIKCVSLHRCNS